MAIKNVCKFEKFGYCKLKEECKDYHPTEVCERKTVIFQDAKEDILKLANSLNQDTANLKKHVNTTTRKK